MSDELKELSEQLPAPVAQAGGRRKRKGGKKSLKKSKKGGKMDKRRLSRRNKRSRRGGKSEKVHSLVEPAMDAVATENAVAVVGGEDSVLDAVMPKQE
jgi:hypothetical protein